MLTAHGSTDTTALKRMARSIELQAYRAAPPLAAQLRSLAARYYAAADAQRAIPRAMAVVATSYGPHATH
jgi:hypothetical protein